MQRSKSYANVTLNSGSSIDSEADERGDTEQYSAGKRTYFYELKRWRSVVLWSYNRLLLLAKPQALQLLLFAMSLLLLLIWLVAVVHGKVQKHSYAVVIDAGSSGTRVHIFAYVPASGHGYSTVKLPQRVLKVEPGLSYYATAPNAAGESIRPLIEYAEQWVPEDLWAETPIYILATAGLRMVPRATSAAIMRNCIDTVKQSHFLFLEDQAEIITGDLEGLYGWAAVNYATGALQDAAMHLHSRHEGAATERFLGVLELGGASMQLTFLTPRDMLPSVSSRNVKLPGVAAPLFTHSFLGFGLDVGWANMTRVARQRHAASSNATDPCLPRGYTAIDGREGGGNFDECQKVVAQMLMDVPSTKLPPLTGRFLAVENFFFTAAAMKLPPRATLHQMGMAARQMCEESYDDLLSRAPESSAAGYTVRYCFSAAYMWTLLHKHLGLGLHERRVLFANTVTSPASSGRDVSVDWPLGALVLRIARTPVTAGTASTARAAERGPVAAPMVRLAAERRLRQATALMSAATSLWLPLAALALLCMGLALRARLALAPPSSGGPVWAPPRPKRSSSGFSLWNTQL